jgi:GNAT superfamily N-acetyltransferase
VERKFLRSAGLVGHVEDIAVAKSMQGRKLGVKLINALEEIGRTQGCYKIILDCSKDNIRECCHLQMNSVLIRGSVLREVRVSGLTNWVKVHTADVFRFKHKEYEMVRYMSDPAAPAAQPARL